jgi:hypothetical protein
MEPCTAALRVVSEASVLIARHTALMPILSFERFNNSSNTSDCQDLADIPEPLALERSP